MGRIIRVGRGPVPEIPQKKGDLKNVFIGTYPPVKCGIATFTKDLTSAINMLNPEELSRIIAVTPNGQNVDYPWEVSYTVEQENEAEYKNAANYINKEKFDVVCLQHEFGIFGGKDGNMILSLLNNIKCPLVTTLHTIPQTPSPNQEKTLKNIIKLSKVVVVMNEVSKERLVDIYNVEPEKIIIIPHGIPDIAFSSTEFWKTLLDAKDKFVIGSFGLLGPGKGYEYLIKSLPGVFKKHPSAVLLIAGETHPKIKALEGEKYRESLIKLAKDLKISDKVFFINKYFSLQELIYIIQAMDIYVAPYPNPQQVSSGALSYAVGSGRACIATPFAYAKEILADGRGILVPFKNSGKITETINYLIEEKKEREKIAHCAYLFGRRMTWVKVADSYIDIFSFLKTIHAKEAKRPFLSFKRPDYRLGHLSAF